MYTNVDQFNYIFQIDLDYLGNAEQSNSLNLLMAQHNLAHYFLAWGCYTLVFETLFHFHMFQYRQTKDPSQTNFHLQGLQWNRKYEQNQHQIKCTYQMTGKENNLRNNNSKWTKCTETNWFQ